ncbi:serine/threonine-protein phosphatase 6 regulatory ankyrin repeat subunit A-like [Euwallacea similis]|uniref:serine/threonine-protein phosphatase 6 regulatory ankyrin repeat subunit A-like n=1 Tax=Euwallacea similis TaxID=1736056 RepID=UPI003450AC7F
MGFSEEKKESFNKFFKEVSSNGFKNINKRDEKGETVLHHAVEIFDYKTVKLLITKGAEINARDKKGYTPLVYCAVFAKSLENVKVLIRGEAEVNATQYLCDSEKSEKASKFLRENGGVTKSRKLTCYGIEGLLGEIADMLDRSYMPELEIMEIEEIRKREKSIIKKECQNLASKIMCQVNEMIDDVIMVKLGKKEQSAKELLENSFKNIYERDEKGITALHYAVDAKIVRLLVEKGANVNAADVGGYTALYLAITKKRLETVRELIKSRADVNAEEYGSKCIPLHLGCMVGEKEIVEELVKAGAEIE